LASFDLVLLLLVLRLTALADTTGWVAGCFLCVVVGFCKGDASCNLLEEKALSKSGDILWDQIIFNVLGHLLDEFGCKLHADGNVLSLEGQIAKFNIVGVDGVLQKGSKMLKKLVEFTHENHGQVRNCIIVVMHPSFCFFVLNENNEIPGKLVKESL
jgi:hypothetical protein